MLRTTLVVRERDRAFHSIRLSTMYAIVCWAAGTEQTNVMVGGA
jgi:hypothetical protein